MKSIKKIFRLIFIISIVLFIWNCEDNYNYFNYEKLEADDKALLERLYNNENGLFDSIVGLAVYKEVDVKDTVDHKESSGLRMIRTYRSPNNDSIKVGHYAGIRFTFWSLFEDEDGVLKIDGPIVTNIYEDDCDSFMVGNNTSSAYVSTGIDEAVQHMFLEDKCTLILPSAIGARSIFINNSVYLQYSTIIADIEVTYWVDR